MNPDHYPGRTSPVLERELVAMARARLAGRTIAAVAAELGTSGERLSKWLAGAITPSKGWLGEIGARLRATMDGSHDQGAGVVRTSTDARKGQE